MSIHKSYSIGTANLLIDCEGDWLGIKVVDALTDCLSLKKVGSTPDEHHIFLRFTDNGFVPKLPGAARELSVSSSLRVLKNGDFCYLLKRDSIMQLDLRNSRGEGSLGSSFWESPQKSQQELLVLSLLWLLRTHGLYGLHANGLEKNGCGLLLVGNTCSGKSTTSVSLIRQGWQYLSDDVTLVRQCPDEIEAIAFQKGFSVDPVLARHYPELEEPLSMAPPNGHKRFLDINSIYPDRQLPHCLPDILIFPRIVPQERSKLIPLDKITALVKLSQSSGGIMVDKEMVATQVEVLKQLVYKTSSYELLAGRDLHEKPSNISDILSEAVGI